eukprot:2181339-Amphidinium_carterae.1
MFVMRCVTFVPWWVRSCVFVLSSGPGPAPEPEIVETAASAVLPAGPHQRVVEHETYAICLDCERHVEAHTGRKCFNCHALK